jgi:hypothetical protein
MFVRNFALAAMVALSSAAPYVLDQSTDLTTAWVTHLQLSSYQRTTAVDKFVAETPDLLEGFKELQGHLNNTQKVEQAFDGSVEQATALLPYSDAIVKSMKGLTKQIKAGNELDLLTAANIGTIMLDILPQSVEVFKNLLAKKPLFDKLGVTGVVAQQLRKERAAAQSLDDAMLAKVPEIAKDEVTDMWNPVAKQFDDIIKQFGNDDDDA